MTLNELADEMVSEAGNNPDDTDHVTEMSNWIKQVAREVWRQDWFFNWAEDTVTTVADQAEYSLDPATAQVLSMQMVSPRRTLIFKTKEYLVKRWADLTTSGTPVYFYMAGRDSATGSLKVRLLPVPNTDSQVITASVKQYPTLAGASVLPFPDDFLDAIREGVRVKIAEDDGDGESAVEHKRNFLQMLIDLKAFYKQRAQDRQRESNDPYGRSDYPIQFPDSVG